MNTNTLWIVPAIALLSSVADCQSSPHYSSQFNGTKSHVIYSNAASSSFSNGWTAHRDPAGAHKGTAGYTKLGGGLLSYRGGTDNFSSKIYIWKNIRHTAPTYRLQVRFRRDGAHSRNRDDFRFIMGDYPLTPNGDYYFAGSASGNRCGVNGRSSAPLPALTSGVWYMFEAISRRTGIEVRVWRDGTARPTTAMVTAPASSVLPSTFTLRGENLNAPQVTVDWLFIGPPETVVMRTAHPNPRIGTTATLNLTAASEPNRPFLVACALGDRPGIRLAGGRYIPLNNDAILQLTASMVAPNIFQGFLGRLDARGKATARIAVPMLPSLRGTSLYAGFVVTGTASPSGIRRISNSTEILIQ